MFIQVVKFFTRGVFVFSFFLKQFEVIKSHTGFKVGDYYGAKGVDDWSAECWANEIGEHDVGASPYFVFRGLLLTVSKFMKHLVWSI